MLDRQVLLQEDKHLGAVPAEMHAGEAAGRPCAYWGVPHGPPGATARPEAPSLGLLAPQTLRPLGPAWEAVVQRLRQRPRRRAWGWVAPPPRRVRVVQGGELDPAVSGADRRGQGGSHEPRAWGQPGGWRPRRAPGYRAGPGGGPGRRGRTWVRGLGGENAPPSRARTAGGAPGPESVSGPQSAGSN